MVLGVLNRALECLHHEMIEQPVVVLVEALQEGGGRFDQQTVAVIHSDHLLVEAADVLKSEEVSLDSIKHWLLCAELSDLIVRAEEVDLLLHLQDLIVESEEVFPHFDQILFWLLPQFVSSRLQVVQDRFHFLEVRRKVMVDCNCFFKDFF